MMMSYFFVDPLGQELMIQLDLTRPYCQQNRGFLITFTSFNLYLGQIIP